MTEEELVGRNISAALREAMNASLSIEAAARSKAGGKVDDMVRDLVSEAVACLKAAQSRLASGAPRAPDAIPA